MDLASEAKATKGKVMIGLKDIESLTNVKRNTAGHVKKIKKSRTPLVLTINGKAELVVRDAESYQQMLEVLDRAETVGAALEGLEAASDRFEKEMRKRIRVSKKG